MAPPRGPVGSPVLAHRLDLPIRHSLLARSTLSVIGVPRTLSSARRQPPCRFRASLGSCGEGGRDTDWRPRKQAPRTAKQEIGWSDSSAASSDLAFSLGRMTTGVLCRGVDRRRVSSYSPRHREGASRNPISRPAPAVRRSLSRSPCPANYVQTNESCSSRSRFTHQGMERRTLPPFRTYTGAKISS
jgi:hypothetical protein